MHRDLGYNLTEADLQLKASELFTKYSLKMREAFEWCDKTRETYEKRINQLEKEAPSPEPFSRMVYSDYSEQIRILQEKTNYASTTLDGVRSIIVDLCMFAECYSNGNFFNPLWGTKPKLSSGKYSSGAKQGAPLSLEEQTGKVIHHRLTLQRSLAPIEEIRLVRLLEENVETDSRYLAVAILFYLGLRPGECCALAFGDIRPLRDYPQVDCLYIHRQMHNNQTVKSRLKTENAYRILPIPTELSALILRRKKVVQAACADISKLPLICSRTSFYEECNRREVTNLCTYLLRNINVRQEVVQNATEQIISGHTDNEAEPTTYLLRRNFATALSGICGAEEDELQYLLGHRIEALDERRRDFLMPELQLAMWKKLNLRRISSLLNTTAENDCLTMGSSPLFLQSVTDFEMKFDETVALPKTFHLFSEYPNDFIKVQYRPLQPADAKPDAFTYACFSEPVEDELLNPKRISISSAYNCYIRAVLNRSNAKKRIKKQK